MVTYRMQKEKQKLAVGEEKYSFGIVAYDTFREEPIRSIADISIDEEAVRRFVDLCNALKLDICHFEDAVEDFLVEINGL